MSCVAWDSASNASCAGGSAEGWAHFDARDPFAAETAPCEAPPAEEPAGAGPAGPAAPPGPAVPLGPQPPSAPAFAAEDEFAPSHEFSPFWSYADTHHAHGQYTVTSLP